MSGDVASSRPKKCKVKEESSPQNKESGLTPIISK